MRVIAPGRRSDVTRDQLLHDAERLSAHLSHEDVRLTAPVADVLDWKRPIRVGRRGANGVLRGTSRDRLGQFESEPILHTLGISHLRG